jgi:class 3 adenylate cyclase
LKSEPVVPLRIGLHIGEVFFEDAKALGDGVNVASRVQSLGQENTILVSSLSCRKMKQVRKISSFQ